MRKLLLATLFSFLAVPAARADVASDRVVLIPGANCPGGGSYDLTRLRQNPDGTTSVDPGPFVTPQGYLLEITDVEFQPLFNLPRFQESIVLTVQNRSTLHDYVAASFAWGPSQIASLPNATATQLTGTGQFVYDGDATHKYTFGSGPLLSSAARLCVSISSPLTQLPGNAYQLILRGRLVQNGTATGSVGPLPIGTLQP